MKPDCKEIERQLAESRREFWAADATINNLEMKLAEMAERLANAESKMESAEKLIDTLRQDKDKVIGMSIERVNELLSRAEAAEKRIAELESLAAPKLTQQALVVPDEMTPKQASRSYCGEVRGYRDGWNACRAAMLQAGNSPVIQDGWVMVPEEPTHEMLEAGDEQFGTYDVYRRMLAAAPKQEVSRG